MAKTKLNTNGFDFEITTPDALSPSAPPFGDVLKLVRQLGDLYAAVSLSEFKVDQDATDPTKFSYRMTAVDGRVWKQDLLVGVPDTAMTFDVPDSWTLSEFVPNRVVRDTVDVLLRQAGVTKIKCTCT